METNKEKLVKLIASKIKDFGEQSAINADMIYNYLFDGVEEEGHTPEVKLNISIVFTKASDSSCTSSGFVNLSKVDKVKQELQGEILDANQLVLNIKDN